MLPSRTLPHIVNGEQAPLSDRPVSAAPRGGQARRAATQLFIRFGSHVTMPGQIQIITSASSWIPTKGAMPL